MRLEDTVIRDDLKQLIEKPKLFSDNKALAFWLKHKFTEYSPCLQPVLFKVCRFKSRTDHINFQVIFTFFSLILV